MKKIVQILALFTVALLVFTACNLDDQDDIYGKVWFIYATVDVPEGGEQDVWENFDLIMEDGTVMKIQANSATRIDLTDGTRVKVTLTIMDEKIVQGKKVSYIHLFTIENVLTRKPLYSSQVDEAALGNDPIHVIKSWFSGPFLNAEFQYKATDNQSRHDFSLLVDEDHPQANEDNVYLELRHNAFGDTGQQYFFSAAAFNIIELIPEGKNSVTIHLEYVNYEGTTIKESGIFVRKNFESEEQSMLMRPETD